MQTSNKLHLNQHGFSPIIGIIAIIVVIGLACGGWYVMQKQNDNKKNTDQTNTQTGQKDTKKDDTQKTADLTEGGKYLVIKEWGVRFEVPSELKDDISYGIFYRDNGTQTAYFASKHAAEIDPGCGLKERTEDYGHGMSGGNVAIVQSDAPDEDALTVNQFQVGNKWYVLSFANGGACSENEAAATAEQQFKTLVADKIRQLDQAQ